MAGSRGSGIRVGAREGRKIERDTAAAVALALGLPLPEKADWQSVFDIVRRERLAGVAWVRSGRIIRREAGPAILGRWNDVVGVGREAEQARLSALAAVLEVLDAAGIAGVALTGPCLSQSLYGDPFIRMGGDLAVCVPPADREATKRSLVAAMWTSRGGSSTSIDEYCRQDGSLVRLQVQGDIVADDVPHLRLPPPPSRSLTVASWTLRVHGSPLQATRLAMRVVAHRLPPLLWLIDFATLWYALDATAQAAEFAAARDAGVHGYLQRAVDRVSALAAAAAGDASALRVLGVDAAGRRPAHPLWEHLRCVPTPTAGARLLATAAQRAVAHGSPLGIAAHVGRGLRSRWRSRLLARPVSGGDAPMEWYVRPLKDLPLSATPDGVDYAEETPPADPCRAHPVDAAARMAESRPDPRGTYVVGRIGSIVAYRMWYSRVDAAHLPGAFHPARPVGATLFVHTCETTQGYRGRGIHEGALAWLASRGAEMGAAQLMLTVTVRNEPARRAACTAGFVRCGTV